MINVLIIDPDIQVCELLSDYLEHDFSVVTVVDSQQAIHQADRIKPDIIILELAIPDQNGLAFLHEFRSYEEWQSIPIILHTMIPPKADVDIHAWRDLGVKEYLYKPTTNLKKLKEIIFNQINANAKNN